MKRSFILFLIALAVISSGCNLLGDKKNSGFDEILAKPPFNQITDSIKQQPDNASLLLRRALLLSENNHHEIAYYDYKKSWDLEPSESTGLLYASNLFLTSRNQEAIDLLQKCHKKFPSNPEFTRRLGEAYVQAGDNKAALALFDEMLKSDSTNFDALYEKGILYTQMKDTAHAIEFLEKSYHLQPVLQNGLALANLYAETENPKTVALCDALLQKDTSADFIDPVFLKGIYYSNTKDYAKALTLFDECIKKDWKFADPVIEKGIIFYDQKNYDAALKEFKTATYINYANPDVYYWMGRVYEDLGKKEEAYDNYSRAVALDRNFTEAKEGIQRLKK